MGAEEVVEARVVLLVGRAQDLAAPVEVATTIPLVVVVVAVPVVVVVPVVVILALARSSNSYHNRSHPSIRKIAKNKEKMWDLIFFYMFHIVVDFIFG